MIKEFLMKKVLQSKLKDMPKEEQEKILGMVQKNPELFAKIADEVQAKVKGGMDQMAAMMEVMKVHQEELKKTMQ